jgi:hypothetical protein
MKKRFEFTTERGAEIVIFAELKARSITQNVKINGTWNYGFYTTRKNGVKCVKCDAGFIPVSDEIFEELENMFAEDQTDCTTER